MDTLGIYAHKMKDNPQRTADSLEGIIQDILASVIFKKENPPCQHGKAVF